MCVCVWYSFIYLFIFLGHPLKSVSIKNVQSALFNLQEILKAHVKCFIVTVGINSFSLNWTAGCTG